MKKKILIISTILFAFLIQVKGQYKITNYTDINQINYLSEEGDYIWVCTSGGVFKRKKSDGSMVTVFNTGNSGIARNVVKTIYIDFYGNYWFGTYQGGVSRFNGEEWLTINEVGGERIWRCETITEDIDGNIWFGVNDGQVVKFDGENWELIDLNGEWYVGSILSDDLGNMWFGVPGINGALWKMNEEGIIEEITDPWNKLGVDTGPYDIAKDLNGNIWIAYYGGAFKYNPHTNHWQDFSSELPTNTFSISMDGEGNVWLGTSAGAYKYDGSTFTGPIKSGDSGDKMDWVLDIMADASGTVWLGSFNGLAKVNESQSGWTPRIEINAVQSNYVEDIVFLNDGTSRMLGQYNYVIGYDGTFFREFYANGGCGYAWVKHLVVDKNNNTWYSFLGYDDRLKVVKMDAEDNANCYTISNAITTEWNDMFVRDVAFDDVNNIFWIATEQGLYLFNASNSFYNKATASNSDLPLNDITGVAVKGDNRIWYSTAGGGIGYLNYMDFSGENFTTDNGLPSNNANAVTFDKKGTLWTLTGFNLSKFDRKNFDNFSVPMYCNKLTADDHGNIWMASSSGGIKFDGTNLRTFTVDDGLIENSVKNIAIDKQGNIWFTSGYYGISKLTVTAPKPDFETQITCLPEPTVFTNTSENTDELTRYEWDIHNDGTVDYTTRDLEHQFTKKGKYEVKLRVYNDNLSAEVVKTIIVLESPKLTIQPVGEKYICKGDFQSISVELDNYNPELEYSFSWNNGLQKKKIFTDTTGIFYVTVSNGQCTTVSDSVEIIASEPYPDAEICMVTVDSSVNKNMIIWERTPDAGIQSYNIYKLYGNNYVPIGNVPYNEKYSYYIDYFSNPDALAARYAITVIDTCGNESDFSSYHQTIHLGSSEGVEPGTKILDWTPYVDESGVFEPVWYYIWAGEKADEMEVVFKISGSFTEWNDIDPGNRKFYKIEARKTDACFVTLPEDKKAGSGPFVHSLSNLEDNTLKTTNIDENSFGELSISPNPFHTEALIKWESKNTNPARIIVYNLQGKIMKEEYSETTDEFILRRENLAEGIYFIRVVTDKVYQAKLYIK